MKTSRKSRAESGGPKSSARRTRHPGSQTSTLDARRASGFTLIELMVVVGIMAIILMIGIPSILRIWQKEGMRKATAELVEICSKARAQAILRGTPMDVVFRSEDNSFSVEPAGGGGGGNVEGRQNEGGGTGLSAHLPDGIGFLELKLNGCNYVEYEGVNVFSFRFYPNGTCDDATIRLLSEKHEMRRITFEITTGLADVDVIQ